MEETLSILEVTNLTRGTRKLVMLLKFFDEAILQCSGVMDEIRVCMGEINEYYNMMPSVET